MSSAPQPPSAPARAEPFRLRDLLHHWGERTLVMAILNATPDSFSGDGLGRDPEAAARAAIRAAEAGADILDIGGQSTRPGHDQISVGEELARVIPAVEAARQATSLPISVDTSRAEVAARALDAGADMINDVWGLRADPELATLVGERQVPVVIMHNRAQASYQDLVGEVISDLETSVRLAELAGVSRSRVIIDPGFGFGKTSRHNLELLRRLWELTALQLPLLLGTSRKSTIGKVLGLPVDQRLEGTAATVALAIAAGADVVRVHDLPEMVRVVRMTDAVVRQPPVDLED